MANIIKLDKSAGNNFKKKLQQMQGGISETNEQLRGAESSAKGLQYASISPNIAQTRGRMEDTSKKLQEFERAYDEYVSEIEKFDQKAARLLQNIPEITEWAQHSGWTADPAIVALNLMEKLVRDGIVMDMAGARAFLLEFQAKIVGLVQSCAYCGDPVNMATGNFIYSKVDLTIPGAFPLVFKRFYNSIGNGDSVMGLNWTHSFNISLEDKGDSVKIVFDDGHMESYEKGGDGSYLPPSGKLNTLVKTEAGFILANAENLTYHFDHKGYLLWKTDLNGNKTTFSHEGGLLAEVSNQSGKLAFAYSTEGLLSEVRDHTGRQVSFTYEDGCLVGIKQPSGAVYKYQYDASQNLSKIINPAGVTAINNEYDKSGRNVRQQLADGGCLSFVYEDEALTTIATEQNDNQIKYVRDANYRTVKIEYEDSEERFEYNDDDKRTMYQDRNGNIQRYEYDSRGNMSYKADPLGNVTQMEYNSFNLPASILRPDSSQVKFSYDQQGNMIQAVDPLQRTMDFAYNTNGQVRRLSMPDGSINELAYDERGNITNIADAFDAKITYEYDELNRVIKTVNGEGHATLFSYNANSDITKVTNDEGKERVYEYNTIGKVSRIIDFNGCEVHYKYNESNKIEEIIDQMGGSTKFCYDKMWNVTGVTDPNGNTISYTYNKLNRLVSATDAEGNITRYEHDANGNVTVVISANGVRTEFKYDALNRIEKVVEPHDTVTRYEYDKVGNIVKVIDPLGNSTRQIFDFAGQLIEIIDPLGNSTKFAYSPLGQVEMVTDAKGGVLRFEYQSGGRIKRVILPEDENESYEYDKNGNIIKVVDGLGNETALVYDSLDRVIEIKNPLGHIKRFAYDAVGNIREVIDENGNRTQYRHSLLGDIIEVIDALGYSTKYVYDKARRLSKVEQSRLIDNTLAGIKQSEIQIKSFERNKNGKVLAIHSPLNKTVRFRYDSVGNMISKLDEDGLETLFEYNLVNKLSQVAYADGKTIQFAYNPLKQLTEMKDWLGITTIEMDAMGRAAKITDFEGKTVQYQWDELNHKEKIVRHDASEVRYRYDRSGKLASVITTSGETVYNYDAIGRVSERVLPDGVVTNYEYNPTGRLTSLIHANGKSILDKLKYGYDPAGNITRIDKQRQGIDADSGMFDYTYDSLGRLITAARGETKKEYIYDSLGNRLASLENGHEVKHQYNSLNQLILTQDSENTEEYRYDGRGNLMEVLENGVLKARYTFDVTNMMVEAFSVDKGLVQYSYDGFRNRVKRMEQSENPISFLESELRKTDPCLEVRYLLDMTRPYDNLITTEGSSTQHYIWGNELIEAEGAEPFYYLQDHLGSPIRLMGGKGDSGRGKPLSYDEFGVPLVETGNLDNPFSFTGYQREAISGLHYAQARYYSPLIGRMISEDPVCNSLNWYTYCSNNPVRFFDPSGCIDKDVTRTLARWLIGNPINNWFTKNGWFKDLFSEAGFVRTKDLNDTYIYHAKMDCLQQYGGYNDFYDIVFDYATSMNKAKFNFSSGGKDYMLWAWKGDYLNLGAGAELGIYTRLAVGGVETDQWLVDQSLAMHMTLTLKLNGNTIINWDPKKDKNYDWDKVWWVTGFNPYYTNVNAGNLTAVYTVTFNTQAMYDDFYNKYGQGQDKDSRWTFDNTKSLTATFSF